MQQRKEETVSLIKTMTITSFPDARFSAKYSNSSAVKGQNPSTLPNESDQEMKNLMNSMHNGTPMLSGKNEINHISEKEFQNGSRAGHANTNGAVTQSNSQPSTESSLHGTNNINGSTGQEQARNEGTLNNK